MKLLLPFLLFGFAGFAQGYTSYFTGNPDNVSTNALPGVCLMGGATENDNAMTWLLEQAAGGDVVVLRSSGTDGYNDYLYSGLGVTVNSVETLVITSTAGAINPYVLNKVANAEMIWFAGGDQYHYISYFKNNALEDVINAHINIKHYPIGGTSAGMAVLGSNYFSAQNGTVSSAEALANPYGPKMTLGANDFIGIPILQNTITDTHFDYYDRKGRLTAFLARIATDQGVRSFGIAANEYVAVCIGQDGKAKVYGDYPNYQEFAFFLQANCQNGFMPENCQANAPLTWDNAGAAIKVYKVPGTQNGANYFDLSDWQSGSGGSWENWRANNGVFSAAASVAASCTLGTADFLPQDRLQLYPVPFTTEIHLEGQENASITITATGGRKVYQNHNISQHETISTTNFAAGVYLVTIEQSGKKSSVKIVKN